MLGTISSRMVISGASGQDFPAPAATLPKLCLDSFEHAVDEEAFMNDCLQRASEHELHGDPFMVNFYLEDAVRSERRMHKYLSFASAEEAEWNWYGRLK